MSQSDKIFAALLLGFLIFITVRGQLGSYANLFVGEPPASASNSGSSSGGFFNQIFSSIGQMFSTILNPGSAAASAGSSGATAAASAFVDAIAAA